MDRDTQSSDVIDISGVDSTPLDLNDSLFDVQSELISSAAKWKSIGSALRLKHDSLANIEAGNSSDPLACLASMVTEWLKRNYNVGKFGEPTWQMLVKAVGHPAGGANIALAKNIARRHEAYGVQQTQQGGAETQLYVSDHQQLSKATVFARENRQAIMDKFADFKAKVYHSLFKNGVDAEQFYLYVTSQFPPGSHIPPPPANLREVFIAITYHRLWDYFHYSPLVQIAKRFGANDPEMKDLVQNYIKDVKAYSIVATLEDYVEADLDVADNSPEDCAKYNPCCYTPVEWKTKFVDHSLQYLAEVWEMFSSHYLMPDSPPTALIDRVRKGCFSITWLVPSSLIPQLIEKVKSDTKFFQQHLILKVMVGNKCVYEESTLHRESSLKPATFFEKPLSRTQIVASQPKQHRKSSLKPATFFEKPLSRTQIVASQLRPTPHTVYYSNFFLLRTPVTVNGQPAQVGCSSGGELTLSCRYPNLSLSLHSIQASLEEVVKTHGVSRVGDVCCEQVPLFPVSFSSEYNLRKFLLHRDTVQQQLGSLFPKLPTQVKLQLFLVTPDTVVKDARVMEVTLENHSACMAVFKESEMFDYWSLFRPYRTGLNKTPSQATVTIKDLITELHDVISWFQLGIYLDISPSELMKIRADHKEKTDDCKTEMLMTWLRQTTDASWSAVVMALVGVRMRALAQKIAVKYGVAAPSAVERKELLKFPVVKESVSSLQSQLLSHAQQLNQEVETYDQRLSEVTHFLEQARMWRGNVTNKMIYVRREAVSAHARVKVLLEKRKEMGRQLQLRKKELNFLQQLQGQLRESEEGKREREELREVLMHKDVELWQLQEQLSEVEKELGCAREEARSLREELRRVTVELAEKSARVQELERAREELKESVNWQRKLVEMSLIQSTAAASSNEALLREIKDQLSSVEEESNKITGSEVEALKQTIADKDREIAELSGELQTLQVQLKTVDKYPSEEKEEEVNRLMVETSELRAKLVEVEGEKQERKRQLEAIHRQKEHLQQLIADLIKKKSAASKPDLQKCKVTGQGLQLAETGQPAHFEVHLVDTAGDPCTTEQQVSAELRSNVDSSITVTSVAHRTPDRYEVSYQPNTRGRHVLNVTVNGEPVQGSPFLVYVRQAPHLLGRSVRIITGLDFPWMITSTGSGELVVSKNHKISFITTDGKKIRSIDTTSVRSGIRRYKIDPMGVAVDENGNIYVTDRESHRLSKFNSDGKLVKTVGGKGGRTGQFDWPHGIALSKDNKLFVCDSNNHRIQVFDTNLKFISCFGKEGSGEGEFRYPYDLTFDPAGDVYVTDNHRVQVFSQNGTFLRTFGSFGSGPGELSEPHGICVDHDYVYVVEWLNSRVSVFYTSGAFITSFGRRGSGEEELSNPCGIAIDEDGFLYVCDSRNNRIQVI